MHLTYRNVNEAFQDLVNLFNGYVRDQINLHYYRSSRGGRVVDFPISRSPSRNGSVLTIEEPVVITITDPRERVLFNEARDANPFLHLYESLWMLAGRNDVQSLAYYAKRFQEFSDDGSTLNGAYGYRWRCASGKPDLHPGGKGYYRPGVDQLNLLLEHLQADPYSRRAVLSMWNVEDDLLKLNIQETTPSDKTEGWKTFAPPSKDVCCNLNVKFRIREESSLTKACPTCRGDGHHPMANHPRTKETIPDNPCPECDGLGECVDKVRVLDATADNRSNDLIWGLLGANIVHFSFLLEYLACRLKVKVGKLHITTNNLHVYDEPGNPKVAPWNPQALLKSRFLASYGPEESACQPSPFPIVESGIRFDEEVQRFVQGHASAADFFSGGIGGGLPFVGYSDIQEPFLREVAHPMLVAHHWYREVKAGRKKDHGEIQDALSQIQAKDWQIVATNWIERRTK